MSIRCTELWLRSSSLRLLHFGYRWQDICCGLASGFMRLNDSAAYRINSQVGFAGCCRATARSSSWTSDCSAASESEVLTASSIEADLDRYIPPWVASARPVETASLRMSGASSSGFNGKHHRGSHHLAVTNNREGRKIVPGFDQLGQSSLDGLGTVDGDPGRLLPE